MQVTLIRALRPSMFALEQHDWSRDEGEEAQMISRVCVEFGGAGKSP